MTPIAGDYPARVRIVVDNDSANDQRGLIWAIRSRHYSSAVTAQTAYEAEELDPLDTATIANAPANLCTNPEAETDTTGWTNNSLTTFERVTSLPTLAGLPSGITTGFHAVGNADNDRSTDEFAVESGKTYRLSAYVYLDTRTATGLALQVTNAANQNKGATATFSTLDAWTRLDVSVTADETATWQSRVRQIGAGNTDFYFTAVLIEQSASLSDYNNVVRHDAISTSWTPMLGTNYGGTGFLTHTGINRIFARVYSESGTAVQSRLVWDVGDLVSPTENPPKRMVGGSAFYLVDYGEVRLAPPPAGTHRWQGQIQAKGDVGDEDFSVDRVWIVNGDEGMGVLQAPPETIDGAAAPTARDEFNQGAGSLAGTIAPTGGAWAEAGDATRFTIETTGKTAQRTAVSDAADTGAWATLDINAASVEVQADVKFSAGDNALWGGVVARYTDTSNHVRALLRQIGEGVSLKVEKRVSGTITELAALVVGIGSLANFRTVTLRVLDTGEWSAFVDGALEASGTDSDLASGGGLASGDVGLYDENTSATASTRNYDNFIAFSPTPDAVIFANQSLELSTQGLSREDSSGSAYGPVHIATGDLPRLPESGLENRTVEVFLKATRGDIENLPDTGIDDLSARVSFRPSWLFVPES